MKLQKKIEVWLVKKRLPQPIDLVQYDTGVQLVFALQDFEIPSGTTATMYIQKPSGKFVFQEIGIAVASDTITVDLHNQAITECGNEVNYQVRLENGSDSLTTFTGIFRVEKSLANDGAMRSETVVAAFEAKTAEQLERIQAEATAQIALVKSESTKQQTTIRNLSQTEQAAIADKGLETLNTIPADYTALSALADKNSREKSPAIVCEASGEIITLSDASDNFVRGLKLYGKTTQVTTEGHQLFDASKLDTKTAGGCTVTNNGDGSLTISGSGTLSETFAISCDYTHEESVALLKEGTLHLAVGGATTPQVMAYLVRNSGTTALDNQNTTAEITQEMLTDTSFFLRLSVYGASGSAIKTGTVKPMLYQNGDGTFEPYTGGKPSPSPEYPQELTSTGDGGSVGVIVTGKNLLPYPYHTEDWFQGNGVTFTVNSDGGVTANGSCSDNVYFRFGDVVLCPGIYRLSGCPTGGASSKYALQIYNLKTSGETGQLIAAEYGGTSRIAIEKTTTMRIMCVVRSGFVANRLTFYPSIVLYSEYDGVYRKGVTRQSLTTQTPNGLCGIPVASGGNYTDENGQQWIYDEVDFARGVYVQRVGNEEFDGSDDETWRAFDSLGNGIFRVTMLSDFVANAKPPIMSNFGYKGTVRGDSALSGVANGVWSYYNSSVGMTTHSVYIKLGADVLLEEWKEELAKTPFRVISILATPIETPLSAEEIAAFKALHTNKPNTTVYNASGAHMEMAYNADTKLYIDNKFAELAAAIVNGSE